MASSITITQNITSEAFSTHNVIAAHSPNIITFEVDPDGKTIDTVEVRINKNNAAVDTYIFEVTGFENDSGVFEYRFDMTRLFKIIVTSNISNSFTGDLGTPPYYVLDDEELSHSISYKIVAYYTDASSDEEERLGAGDVRERYLLINAVRQLMSHSGTLLQEYNHTPSSSQPILSPRPAYNQIEFGDKPVNLKFWLGYPMQLGFIIVVSPDPESYELTDLTTTNSVTYAAFAHSSEERILMKLGLGYGSGNHLSMTAGKTTLEISNSVNSQVCSINTEVVDKNVIYVKWLNSLGFWSYWGFNCEGIEELNTKTEVSVIDFFDSMVDAIGNKQTISKSSKRSLTVFDQYLSKEELDYIAEIGDSIAVYLWTATKGTAARERYWLNVDVEKMKLKTKQSKQSHSAEISLSYPTQYTQTH